MKKEWSTVEVLSHYRHDWLNKIQLIKGNLSLNNIERVKEIIDEIVLESREESRLSNVNLPQFFMLLLTFNWESSSLRLDYEVLNEEDEYPMRIDDQLLTRWTNLFLNELQESIQEYYENHMSITIAIQSKGFCFFFDFRGIIKDRAKLESFLTNESLMEIKILQFSEQELALEVMFPYSEQ